MEDFILPQLGQRLWKKYGMRANPFDTSPLSLTSESSFPIAEAIVGRGFETYESRSLYNVLCNPGGARVIIEGQVGVGKTTFVNYHRYIWENHSQDRLFTPQEEIAVTEHWQLSHFLINILSSLISKLILVIGEKEISKIPVFQEVLALSRVFFQSNLSIEGSFMGFGGGFSRSQNVNVPSLPEIQLIRYFREMVRQIKRMNYAGVFLHIDNLEILRREDTHSIRAFLDNIRDCLQTPDVYFVFVSNQGFFRDIIASLPRVRSIFFGKPVIISPLTKVQVVEAVHKRYHILSIDKKKFVKPVEDTLIEYLYDLYKGNMRYIMDALNMAVPNLLDQAEYTIPTEKATLCLQHLMAEQISTSLTSLEWEILCFCKAKEKFTNKMVSDQFHIPSSNAARAMEHLRDLNLIYLDHKEGKKIYYCLTEYSKMATPVKYQNEIKPTPFSPIEKRTFELISFLQKNQKIRHQEYVKLLKVSLATATRDLNQLVKSGKLCRIGQGKKSYYELVKQ